MSEWDYPGATARGDRGRRVRLVQEWLCLHGINVAVDGSFGPATYAAVRAFQSANHLPVSGKAGRSTWEALVAPMVAALTDIGPGGRTLGQLVVAYARQHLTQRPREVGGQNMGPWVRLYMKGNEGPQWPWCAGFACFVLRQASQALKVPMPVPYTFSCDSLAAAAKDRGIFVAGNGGPPADDVPPGSLFLSRHSALDWVHTGIILSPTVDTLDTIEGNTNDSGEREGYEVCHRVRGYVDKDFITIH